MQKTCKGAVERKTGSNIIRRVLICCTMLAPGGSKMRGPGNEVEVNKRLGHYKSTAIRQLLSQSTYYRTEKICFVFFFSVTHMRIMGT